MSIKVKVGNLYIGGGSCLSIQSMLKNNLSCYTDDQLRFFYNSGCDIMRFSIIAENSEIIRTFKKKSLFPLVADIQGSINQVESALKAGVDAIRINPGNFSLDKISRIVYLCAEHSAAVRIGINEASLSTDEPIESVVSRYINFFESNNFHSIILSVKSSDPFRTLQLNRSLSKVFNYPIHIGLTESGFGSASAVRSTFVLQQLMAENIGDTLRYSIAGGEIEEIRAGRELLALNGGLPYKFRIVACPMCARHGVDTFALAENVEKYIFKRFDIRKLNLTVAVMGCPINGRGEAENADLAVCATYDSADLYLGGKFISHVKSSFIEDELVTIINDIIKTKGINNEGS